MLRVPEKDKPRRNMLKYKLIKLIKIKYKEKIKSNKKTYKGNPIRFQLTFQQKHCRPEGSGRIYLKRCKRKTFNQEYSNQQYSHSDSAEKSKAL